MPEIHTILDQIDSGAMALPMFQRGYVWNRDQVRALFTSLYRGYPIGTLLVWQTTDASVAKKGGLPAPVAPLSLLLDGQQRMTSLYGVIRGRAPEFFEGNERAFSGLYFNIDSETFQFHQPVMMDGDPRWLSVTSLLEGGEDAAGPILERLGAAGLNDPAYMGRVLKLLAIRGRDLYVELVTGDDKTVGVVVDIFNRVNSGGTKLSQGDLALAKICAEWPEARGRMHSVLEQWGGYDFDLDWLLRVVNAVLKGEAPFTNLHNVGAGDFEQGLKLAERYASRSLTLLRSRLGLDHGRVLSSRLAIPVMARYLSDRDGKLNVAEQDKLLYWYVQMALWGRYSGSSETALDQDIKALAVQGGDPLDILIERLRIERGRLTVEAQHFHGSTRLARFYPVLHMLSRMGKAQDLLAGLPVGDLVLGKMDRPEVHHIFPKAQLKRHGYDKRQINALANFCLVTKDTNLKIGSRLPAEYFRKIRDEHPGALESQWMPMDERLWEIDNYLDFLEARKRLLADGLNEHLASLLHGAEVGAVPSASEATAPVQTHEVLGGLANEEEEEILVEVNAWVIDRGMRGGVFGFEVVDADTGEQIAILDLAWPDGVQAELTAPVALLVDEEPELTALASERGFRCFTDVAAFKRYVDEEILEPGVRRE